MIFPPHLGPDFMRIVQKTLDVQEPDHVRLNVLWNLLVSLQNVMLGHVLTGRIGDHVFAGPFRGMRLIKAVQTQPFCAQLLGTYEWELHEAIEAAIKRPYKNILNIGSGFGYYSIGFARRMQDATVHAYDSDETARDHGRKMAALNEVEDRVMIHGRFEGANFEKYAGEPTLVFMDIAGEERAMLDPALYPALLDMDVIVQMHAMKDPQIEALLPARFEKTHATEILRNVPFNFPLEKILGEDFPHGHLDGLIASWERRDGPAPFGVFLKSHREK